MHPALPAPPEGFTEDRRWWATPDLSPSAQRRQDARLKRQHHPMPFAQLPRRHRRELLAALRWRIRSDPDGQGVFTSHDILPGSRAWPLTAAASPDAGPQARVEWADVLFASAAPLRLGRFYNATVETVALVASRQVIALAQQAIQAQMGPDGGALARLRTFTRRLPNGHTEMRFAPSPRLDSLGGLTREGALAQWLEQHLEDWPGLVQVRAGIKLHPGYAYGQGLSIVADVPGLTVDTLASVVREFLAGGERQASSQPLDMAQRRHLVDPLLGVHLWRWRARAARDTGQPDPPPPGPEVLSAFQHESNAVRV